MDSYFDAGGKTYITVAKYGAKSISGPPTSPILFNNKAFKRYD